MLFGVVGRQQILPTRTQFRCSQYVGGDGAESFWVRLGQDERDEGADTYPVPTQHHLDLVSSLHHYDGILLIDGSRHDC